MKWLLIFLFPLTVSAQDTKYRVSAQPTPSTDTTIAGFLTMAPGGTAIQLSSRAAVQSFVGVKRGNATFNGTAFQTAYVVTHGLGFVPGYVFIQPTSQNASVLNWVTNKTATTFTVNFNSIPIVGVGNIQFDWLAYK